MHRPTFPSLAFALGSLAAVSLAEARPSFRVEIEGSPVASANVESVLVDDLEFEVLDLGVDPSGARVFGPGDAHFGSITIRVRRSPGPSELHQWWLDTSRGENIRKNISVIALKRDGSEARRFHFLECFPTRWDPGEYSPSSNVACETIVAKMGRVELASAGPSGGGPAGGGGPGGGQAGFEILIGAPGAGSGSDVDSAWETCAGGSLRLAGGDPAAGIAPERDVTELRLRGPLTAGRQALCQWVNEAQGSSDARRELRLRERARGQGEAPTFSYLDCFVTRYVFPAFSLSALDPDDDGDVIDAVEALSEEVTIKPIRLELR